MTQYNEQTVHNNTLQSLLYPQNLWSSSEVLLRPSPVPKVSGIYAWYFRQIPPGVPTADCHTLNNLTLLYIGISPGLRTQRRSPSSRQNLKSRVRYHLRGNAEGSTLRRSLGCLLQNVLGIELRRVGSGKRMTFGPVGEQLLSAWLAENAFVATAPHPEPWEAERELIATLSLPLNLDQNKRHAFCETLSAVRRTARLRAMSLPIGHAPTTD